MTARWLCLVDHSGEHLASCIREPEYHRCIECQSRDDGQRDWGLDHAQRCGGEVPRPPGWNRPSDDTERPAEGGAQRP